MMLSAIDVTKLFIEANPNLRLTKTSNSLVIGNKPLAEGKDFGAKCISQISHLLDEETKYQLFTNPDYSAEVRDEIARVFRDAKAKEFEAALKSKGGLRFNASIACPLSDLLYIKNVEDERSSVLYDPLRDITYPYDSKLIDATLSRKLGEGYGSWIETNERQCYLRYIPFADEKRLFESLEHNHWVFNTWSKPAWREGWHPDPGVKTLHPDTEEFLKLLSPEHYEYLLGWLRDFIFDKADPVLILRGASGCGKNLFADFLAGNLVGKSGKSNNWVIAARNFETNNFDAYIGRHQLVIFDEVKMGFTLIEKLKQLHNGSSTLQEKNVRIMGTSKIFCSMIAITNHKRNIELNYNDRKFLVLALSDLDLLDIKSQEWIDNLKAQWQDPQVLRDIASYLFYHVEKIKRYPIKTKPFLELCWLNSLPEWFKRFLTLAVDYPEFSEGFFRDRKHNKIKAELFTIQEQINLFEVGHKLKKPIGAFYRIKGGKEWRFKSDIYGKEELIIRDKTIVTEGDAL